MTDSLTNWIVRTEEECYLWVEMAIHANILKLDWSEILTLGEVPPDHASIHSLQLLCAEQDPSALVCSAARWLLPSDCMGRIVDKLWRTCGAVFCVARFTGARYEGTDNGFLVFSFGGPV